jgi:hypothetical protein
MRNDLRLYTSFTPIMVLLLSLLIALFPVYAITSSISYESSQLINQSSSGEFDAVGADPVSNWAIWSMGYSDRAGPVLRQFSGQIQYNQYAGDLVYTVPELYIQYEDSKRFRVSAGRRELDWNPLEKFWMIGEINPLQGLYLQDSTQEGLMGIQLDYPWGPFDLSLFVSYLYVPQMNPRHSIDDGKVTTASRWSTLPPSATMINGNLVPIYYTLESTSVGDVIWQQSLGTRLDYTWSSGRFGGFGLYKPENRLRMRGDAYYDQQQESVIVKVEPLVNHQLIYGFHGEQRLGNFTLQAAAVVVDPNARVSADLLVIDPIRLERNDRTVHSQFFTIAPKFYKQRFVMADLTWKRDRWVAGIKAIKQLEEQPVTGDDFYGERSRWQSAVGGELSFEMDKSNFQAEMRYDFEHQANLLALRADYQLIKQINLSLSLEMIEVGSDDSYWSAYRTNDVVYSRITYLF